MGGRPLDTITMTEIEAWVKFIAKKRGRIAANRHYTVLRACLEHAVEAGYLRDNPARYVKKYPENPPRQRVLSDEELGKVLDAVRGSLTLSIADSSSCDRDWLPQVRSPDIQVGGFRPRQRNMDDPEPEGRQAADLAAGRIDGGNASRDSP